LNLSLRVRLTFVCRVSRSSQERIQFCFDTVLDGEGYLINCRMGSLMRCFSVILPNSSRLSFGLPLGGHRLDSQVVPGSRQIFRRFHKISSYNSHSRMLPLLKETPQRRRACCYNMCVKICSSGNIPIYHLFLDRLTVSDLAGFPGNAILIDIR